MTKFIDKLVDAEFHGINDDEISHLLHKLELFINNNLSAINIIIDNFQKSKKEYGVVELSNTILIVLNNSKKKGVTLNIGYPFPIFSESRNDLANILFGNVKINLFIRGEILRKLQRNYLKKSFFNASINKKWFSINKIDEFRKISTKLLKKKNRIIYIDPYHFIGDSFTGLYFLEQFEAKTLATDIIVLSKFFMHLNLFYKSYKKDANTFKNICIDGDIVIMPDLIDNHFGENLKLLNIIQNKDITIFILSRSLIINYQKNKIRIYHYNKNDVLLRNKNIEDYMDDCLNPFLKKMSLNYRKRNEFKKDAISEIFINPYSSNPLKEIGVELFLKIAASLTSNDNIRFVISNNNGTIEKKNDWLNELILKMKKTEYRKLSKNIVFLSDNSIADLGRKLLKRGISCALTADTSISHFLSKLMIPNITIYNESFWDNESAQSLSAESPLGFCRYDFPHFAAISKTTNDSDNFSNDIKNWLQALLSITNGSYTKKIPLDIYKFYKKIDKYTNHPATLLSYSNHKKLYFEYLALKRQFQNSEFTWLFDIYDPDKLITKISTPKRIDKRFLFYSSWKNLPLYKFINYFWRY